MYTGKLPGMDRLGRLVRLAGPFPATARRLVFYAKHFGFGRDVVSFLHLFKPGEIFASRADFINRCNELEIFISQAREMPKETLTSPQG